MAQSLLAQLGAHQEPPADLTLTVINKLGASQWKLGRLDEPARAFAAGLPLCAPPPRARARLIGNFQWYYGKCFFDFQRYAEAEPLLLASFDEAEEGNKVRPVRRKSLELLYNTWLDLDGSGAVDGADLGLLLSEWGNENSCADLNDDGAVDGADLGILFSHFG